MPVTRLEHGTFPKHMHCDDMEFEQGFGEQWLYAARTSRLALGWANLPKLEGKLAGIQQQRKKREVAQRRPVILFYFCVSVPPSPQTPSLSRPGGLRDELWFTLCTSMYTYVYKGIFVEAHMHICTKGTFATVTLRLQRLPS